MTIYCDKSYVNVVSVQYLFVLYLPFHLKKALYDFSSACLTCQHHYACALGPLLSNIRVN